MNGPFFNRPLGHTSWTVLSLSSCLAFHLGELSFRLCFCYHNPMLRFTSMLYENSNQFRKKSYWTQFEQLRKEAWKSQDFNSVRNSAVQYMKYFIYHFTDTDSSFILEFISFILEFLRTSECAENSRCGILEVFSVDSTALDEVPYLHNPGSFKIPAYVIVPALYPWQSIS